MKTVPGFEKKLSLYALTGAAAFVASGGADAAIVHVTVGQTFSTATPANSSYAINPSGGATPDVNVGAYSFTPPNSPVDYYDNATSSSSARIRMDSTNTYVAALAFNDLIDPTSATNWGTGGKMVNNLGQGPWSSTGGSAYLGFYFSDINGVHAGWAAISTAVDNSHAEFTLTDYAYETVSNEAIKAGQLVEGSAPGGTVPEPASIALLAMGAAGIAAVRRRRAHA